jgi:FKBP-type peptidyl-prolyl cis-trans isomerase 2
MIIGKGDFVSVSFSGKLADTHAIFDTTDEAIAKAAQIFDKRKQYGPITICAGENQVLTGLDESLIGKKVGESYTILCLAEKAFGKKDPKKIELIALSKFKDQKINPTVNMTVYVDGKMGFIKTIGSGRALVDFNHPFAGKAVQYNVKIVEKVEDDNKKVNAVLGVTLKEGHATVTDTHATITTKVLLPEPFQKIMSTHIQKLVPTIKSVSFESETPKSQNINAQPQTESEIKPKTVKRVKKVKPTTNE